MLTEIKWDEVLSNSGKIFTIVNDKGDERKFSYNVRTNQFILIRETDLSKPFIFLVYDKNTPQEGIKIFINE
jgi:hypothetical protein